MDKKLNKLFYEVNEHISVEYMRSDLNSDREKNYLLLLRLCDILGHVLDLDVDKADASARNGVLEQLLANLEKFKIP